MKQDNMQHCNGNSVEERLPYHAPAIKVHGKLERFTLSGPGSTGLGGGGGALPTPTGDPGGEG